MRHLRSLALTLATLGVAAGAAAQLAPPDRPAAKPANTAPLSSPLGQGAGVHDPRSAFKPLEDKEGVVSWKLLSSVQTKMEKNRIAPVFPDPVLAMNEKTVRVQGFMMPLEPGERQKHFLLSAVPTTCSFCVPAGPQGLIEVRSKIPVKYSIEAVTVEGKFAALEKDPYGLFYRVSDATPAGQ